MSNAKKAPETAAALVPFYVVITVCDLETGQAVPVSRIDCRDLLHARNLLAEMSELAQDIHFGRVADQWEEQEDGRQFLETCAAEHSFRDLLA